MVKIFSALKAAIHPAVMPLAAFLFDSGNYQ